MKRSDINEALTTLYLRLNGYFTTGLVAHAPKWGRNASEIDCLAVRHPNHAQTDRGIGTSSFLAPLGDETDLLICEVKSNPEMLAFNDALLSDVSTIAAVLNWSGVLDPAAIDEVASQFQANQKLDVTNPERQGGVVRNGVRVRGLLSCPSVAELTGWALSGGEILRYARECFNPPSRREDCSTQYNFLLWGHALSPIVRYIKTSTDPSLDGLYEAMSSDHFTNGTKLL